jgi:hypothetical protein
VGGEAPFPPFGDEAAHLAQSWGARQIFGQTKMADDGLLRRENWQKRGQ